MQAEVEKGTGPGEQFRNFPKPSLLTPERLCIPATLRVATAASGAASSEVWAKGCRCPAGLARTKRRPGVRGIMRQWSRQVLVTGPSVLLQLLVVAAQAVHGTFTHALACHLFSLRKCSHGVVAPLCSKASGLEGMARQSRSQCPMTLGRFGACFVTALASSAIQSYTPAQNELMGGALSCFSKPSCEGRLRG